MRLFHPGVDSIFRCGNRPQKGQTATFRYGFRAREHMDVLQMHITVLASKNHDQQYHGSYKVDFDMGE